jgi:hypothetical protein
MRLGEMMSKHFSYLIRLALGFSLKISHRYEIFDCIQILSWNFELMGDLFALPQEEVAAVSSKSPLSDDNEIGSKVADFANERRSSPFGDAMPVKCHCQWTQQKTRSRME